MDHDGTSIAIIRSMKARELVIVSHLWAGVTVGLIDSANAQAADGQLLHAHLERSSVAAVQPYSQAVQPYSQYEFGSKHPTVPRNISVGPGYRVTLETMLTNSRTFRRQCARLEGERFLTVHVRQVQDRLLGGVRAITHISRLPEGRIIAHVTLHAFDNDVEMIAHEFEHIIEQLDEVDLATKARRAQSGVHAIDLERSMFETERARQVGLRVVEEMRKNSRKGASSS